MRRFAFLIAVIAWLFTSLMPALALPLAGPQHHAMVEAMPQAEHSGHHAKSAAADHACPDCDTHPTNKHPIKTSCAMSLCAACTSLVPDLMLTAFRPALAGHPAALPTAPLSGMAPGPADPPPRA